MKLITDEVQERVLKFLDKVMADPENFTQEFYEEAEFLVKQFERKRKKKVDITSEV